MDIQGKVQDPGGPIRTLTLFFFIKGATFLFGGWRVTDGGWRATDGGWRVTDGGRRVAIRGRTLVFGPGMFKI